MVTVLAQISLQIVSSESYETILVLLFFRMADSELRRRAGRGGDLDTETEPENANQEESDAVITFDYFLHFEYYFELSSIYPILLHAEPGS